MGEYDGQIIIDCRLDDGKITQSLKQMGTNASRAMSQIAGGSKSPFGAITKDIQAANGNINIFNASLLKMGASIGGIFTVRAAFNQLVSSVRMVEDSLTEMNVSFGLSKAGLQGLSSQIFNVANSFGASFSDAAKSMGEFSRSGMDIERSLAATSAALALTRISGLELSQSISTITSVLQTFKSESLSAMQITQMMSNIDLVSAASSKDLAQSLLEVGSSAKDAGVNLASLLSLISSTKSITQQSAATIGTSYKTIFARLGRTEVISDLESLGVQTRRITGDVKPAVEILTDLAQRYGDLSRSQKSIATQAFGEGSLSTLKGLMADLSSSNSQYSRSLAEAEVSGGGFEDRLKSLNQTISSQLLQSGNNLKELFSNLGSGFKGPASQGISSFNTIVKKISFYIDSSSIEKNTSIVEGLGVSLGTSIVSGISKALTGPGLLVLSALLLKVAKNPLSRLGAAMTTSPLMRDENGAMVIDTTKPGAKQRLSRFEKFQMNRLGRFTDEGKMEELKGYHALYSFNEGVKNLKENDKAGRQKLRNEFSDRMSAVNFDKFEEFRVKREKWQAASWKGGMIGAGISSAFGGAFAAAGNVQKPDAFKGWEEISSAASTAAVGFMLLPKKLAIVSSLALGVTGIIKAFDVGSRTILHSEKDFQLLSDKTKNTSALLNNLVTSLNTYDELVDNASASFSDLDKANRAYTENISRILQTTGGKGLVERLSGASTTREKTAILQSEQSKNERELQFAESILALKKHSQGRQYLSSQNVFGLQPFGAGSETERESLNSTFKGLAQTGLGRLSGENKDRLTLASTPQELESKFQELILEGGDQKAILESILNSIRELKWGGSDIAFRQMFTQLQTTSRLNLPARIIAEGETKSANFEGYLAIENSLNRARSSARNYLNWGSLGASNNIGINDTRNKESLNRNALGIAAMSAQGAIYKQQYGERTNINYEGAIQQSRIRQEQNVKIQEESANISRTILGAFTQNFDQGIKNLEAAAKSSGLPGAASFTMGPAKQNLLESLNKGLEESFAQPGGITRFAGPGGIDINAVRKDIADRSSEDTKMRGNVTSYLEANSSAELLKALSLSNEKLVQIDADALQQSRQQTVVQDGLLREQNFKSLANYLGGIKGLLDRGSRRSTERDLVQGATLMTQGRSPEARAKGAALYLKTLDEMKVKNPNDGSPLSQMINLAHQIGPANLQQVQGQSVGRVVGGTSRLLGNRSLAAAAARQLASQNTLEASTAAFQNEYRPENKSITSNAQKDSAMYTSLFNTNLSKSTTALLGFSDVLKSLKDKMISTEAEFVTTRKFEQEQAAKRNKELADNYGTTPSPSEPVGHQAKDNWWQSVGATVGEKAGPIIGNAIGVAVGLLLYNKTAKMLGFGGGAAAGTATSATPGLISRGIGWAGGAISGGTRAAGTAITGLSSGMASLSPMMNVIARANLVLTAIATALTVAEMGMVNYQTKGLINKGRGLDAQHTYGMGEDIGRFNNPSITLAQLTNKQNSLTNLKETDASGGWGGMMNRLFRVSPKQFGSLEERELSKVSRQREQLSQAMATGESDKIIAAMKDLQEELTSLSGKITENTTKKSDSQAYAAQVGGTNNVAVYVDLNASDTIAKIGQAITTVQNQVNEILNRVNPRPAIVKENMGTWGT